MQEEEEIKGEILETILIVDDDQILRESLSLLLSKNYNVLAASSASEALSFLASQDEPVIALLDYMMPVIDGIELLQLIKEKYSNLPVIMLTASDNIKSAVRAMKMGATDFINKPFDIEELLFRIAESCLLYTSPSPRDATLSRMPSSA